VAVPSSASAALLALAVLMAGCVKVRVENGDTSEMHVERISAVSRHFSQLYEKGDAAGMAALYTPDGVIFPPGRAAIQGWSSIESFWRLAAGERITSHRATTDSVVVEGRTAYDWGTYRVSGERNGAAFTGGGKYVIVWREVTPGVWRMHLDMWNAGPPRAAAPPN
jgi:ketosteroid isomerase-like protein